MPDPNTPEPIEPWLLKIDALVKGARRRWHRLSARPGKTETQERGKFWSSWSTGERVIAAVGVAFVVLVVGIPTGVNAVTNAVEAAEQQRIADERWAAERAAARERNEEQAREQEEREEEKRRDELNALEDAPGVLAEADATLAASTWANAVDLGALKVARDKLATAIDSRDGGSAIYQMRAIPDLMVALGTPETAQDKAYEERGKTAPFLMTAQAARAWCSDSVNRWNSDRVAAISPLRGPFDAGKSAAVDMFCPDLAVIKQVVDNMIEDGRRGVGPGGIPAGTWRTVKPVSNCYWERSTGNGDIIENNFINHAPDGATVTVNDGEGFTTQRCGFWERIG